MNEVVQGFGYYEIIVGGLGVGVDWQGESGVYIYVMNIRMLDFEIFEKKYFVLL